MKKFVLKTSLFTIILMFCLAFLEYYIFPNNNNQMTLKNDLIMNSNKVDVMILGNSHTFFGVNPDESDFKMINIANKGRKLETDYYILKNATNLNVDYILIPISHFTLLAGELSSKERRLYYRFFNIENYSQSIMKNHLIFNEPFRELIHGVFFTHKKHHSEYITKLGWKPEEKNYVKDKKEIIDRINSMEKDANNNQHINRNLKYLDSIISLGSKRNISIVLITPPYHKDYIEYRNESYHKFIDSTLNRKQNSKNKILYINGDSLQIKNDYYYKNADHLNTNGAKIFTKKIDSILKINS